MTRQEKINLLRKIENQAGLEKFNVDIYSDEEDVNNSLQFCLDTIEILESFKDKINEAVECETEPEPKYSIIDLTK